MKVGQKYYIITHAYYHVVGEVTAVISPKLVSLKNVVLVYSSSRSWTDFFKSGFAKGDRFDVTTDMANCSVINAWDWPHPIPKEKS